ncbi:universal stress protein UspA [Geomicrobium sp. JCM 19039]|uniref:universal stress protein UspA n=1 Tax=Geomicrobium sp. JCM 19039 TaxID=1460636 RepID=UPI00045F1B8D|nr:universal stress protein UspA [Geomicrobium sp. JCM 19039]GAK14738.1 osmosensitive K+ channel histidine kinase KdpD [Geomicrobium sp. JCM 19039]
MHTPHREGAELARTSDARLYILIFDSLPEDDYKNDKLVDMSIFQELAEQCDAQLIIENSQAHNITRVIKKTAENVEATQVVIGQQVENLWTTLIGGSIIDVLLHELPSADLHVVPKPRADAEADWNFERGVNAYLIKQTDDSYVLSFNHEKNTDFEGIFFKYLGTDFNNGLFAFHEDNRVYEVRVRDSVVHSLDDVI